MKTIIGLVGEKGSGKETFGNFLMETSPKKISGAFLRIRRIRFSDILNQTLMLWTIPKTRENLQHLAVVMDTGFGTGTLTDSISNKIKRIDADIVILDGVRWETDEMLVRNFPKNYLIYITADADLRFERLKKRSEKKGEAKTLTQFLKSEKAKNELLIQKIGKRANVRIVNNGTFEDLKKQVENFYRQYLKS